MDWHKDLEKDNLARAPLRHPRQPPKVMIFQMRKLPVGWPNGVWKEPAPPKPETVPEPDSGLETENETIPMPELENEYVPMNNKPLEDVEWTVLKKISYCVKSKCATLYIHQA